MTSPLSTAPSAPVPTDSSGPIRATWRIDVGDVVPLEGVFEIAVDVLVPPRLSADASCVVLSCLPGGYLSRRYFDLRTRGGHEGANGARYSFAEAMGRHGFVTLAFDHVGVGESSKPDPIEGGYALGVETIARVNQAALERTLDRLRAGDPPSGLPPLRPTSTLGVGHSMGSLLTVEQQAIARTHDALVLFSFATAGLPGFLNEEQRRYANDPVRARAELGELVRRTMGSPYPARPTGSEEDRVAAFGVGTAPPSAEEALHGASTNLLALGGLLSMIPGGYAPPAQQIDVPVLIAIGDHDLHDERGLEAMLPRSPEVTTFVLEDCWHCHFVANTREELWQHVAQWIQGVLDRDAPLE